MSSSLAGREGGREGERERERERRKKRREGGREERRERGREGGREGGREEAAEEIIPPATGYWVNIIPRRSRDDTDTTTSNRLLGKHHSSKCTLLWTMEHKLFPVTTHYRHHCIFDMASLLSFPRGRRKGVGEGLITIAHTNDLVQFTGEE